MDDTIFDIELHDVAAVSRRFPAHRRVHAVGRPDADFSYLSAAAGSEFGRHAWDEGGHF